MGEGENTAYPSNGEATQAEVDDAIERVEQDDETAEGIIVARNVIEASLSSITSRTNPRKVKHITK